MLRTASVVPTCLGLLLACSTTCAPSKPARAPQPAEHPGMEPAPERDAGMTSAPAPARPPGAGSDGQLGSGTVSPADGPTPRSAAEDARAGAAAEAVARVDGPAAPPPRDANAESVRFRQGKQHRWAQLPAGTFTMGTPAGRTRCEGTWRETPHQVTLTRAFEMSTLEITERQFAALMGYRPSSLCDDCPAANISWHELAAYCNALSREEAGAPIEACFDCTGQGAAVACRPKPGFDRGRIYDCPGFRLMTEAEFEYALRAGTTTDTYLGDLPDGVSCDWNAPPTPANRAIFDRLAIYRPVSDDRAQPVGSRQPNGWGLHDLGGNVWERTFDVRQVDLSAAPATDPWGAPSGTNMTSRGGSYHYTGIYLRSGDRGNQSSTREERGPAAGGRCVRSLLP